MFYFNKKYFSLTLLLFITEILIAVFVHDRFIRPYFGDYLVVIFLYSLLKSFVRIPVVPATVTVLIFSYLVETLQYYNLVSILGLQHSKIARIVIGTGFSWWDIVAYSLGCITIVLIEVGRKNRTQRHEGTV